MAPGGADFGDGRLNINVSAVDYDSASKALARQMIMLEQMTHTEDEFAMTDSEFAFGWHFFVLSGKQIPHTEAPRGDGPCRL